LRKIIIVPRNKKKRQIFKIFLAPVACHSLSQKNLDKILFSEKYFGWFTQNLAKKFNLREENPEMA